LIVEPHRDPKRFLLFLPEGELHEMGLLFYHYLIRKRGHEVIYFGQSVPLRDLAEASSVLQYDYLLTSIISIYNGKELVDYFYQLVSAFPQKTIYVTGNQVMKLSQSVPDKIKKIDSPDHFIRFLEGK
jgi:hypothetical protein